MKKTVSTRMMVISALFAAMTFVATSIHIHVPVMLTGYVSLGDCLVLVSGLLLGPVYGSMAAGLGSAMTDLLHGYAMYVLPTFLIKSLMALAVYYLYFKVFKGKKSYEILPIVIASVFAEIIMIGGYFLFEGAFLVGFVGAAQGIIGYSVQAAIAISVSPVLMYFLKKTRVTDLLEHYKQ